jgi:phospho-N-acetylmuramoyl-pentapeptide-transferase
VTLTLIQGLLLAFALVVILMPPYIRFLRYLGFGKRIREEGPSGHLVKEGTPTMGGLLLIIVVLGVYLVINAGPPQGGIIPPLAALGIVGGLGAVDDYLNARTGEGIRARQKLIWLVVFAVFFAWQIQQTYGLTGFRVPAYGDLIIHPFLWVVFAAFAIVATANGVNITDGLDGLAGGTLIFAFVAFLIIALLNVVPLPTGKTGNQPQVALLCALLIGGLLGFLWFNVHPAQVFMGDSGSLAFGATLAVIAIITGQLLVLPLIGLIFVVETGSVIVQVAYFKVTGGKRLFRMSPIHHHFELGGWDEEKITLRFWIVAVLAGLLGVTLFLASLRGFQLEA